MLVGAAVAVLGAILAALGLQGSPGHLTAHRPNRFVNQQEGIDAHNSPAAAVDPSRPAVMAVADRIDTPSPACSVHRSTDAGRAWRRLDLPLPPGSETCFAPDVAFDDRGDLLVLYATVGGSFNQPTSTWLQRFVAEAPRGPAVRVAGPASFHARMAVRGARVVVAWVQARAEVAERPLGFPPPPNPVVASRSDDGGQSFSTPVAVSEPHRLVAQPTVGLGPGEEVVVGALDLGDDLLDYEGGHGGQAGPPAEGRWRVVTWTSTDAGRSFAPASTVTADLVAPERIYVDLGPTPGLARDPRTGRLYAAWDAGRGDARDVFLSWSDDRGATWSSPKRVAPRRSAQFLPAVGVSPDGRLDLAYYDRGGDPDEVLAEVVVASSWDGGASFVTATASDRSFDSRIGFGSAQGLPQLGSQLAVISAERGVAAFWADTRRGTVDTNAQDLAVGRLGASPPQALRQPVFTGGALLLVVGGAIALVRWRRHDR